MRLYGFISNKKTSLSCLWRCTSKDEKVKKSKKWKTRMERSYWNWREVFHILASLSHTSWHPFFTRAAEKDEFNQKTQEVCKYAAEKRHSRRQPTSRDWKLAFESDGDERQWQKERERMKYYLEFSALARNLLTNKGSLPVGRPLSYPRRFVLCQRLLWGSTLY